MASTTDYTAFISYRHEEPDQKISRQIHRFLETYRIPRALRKNAEDATLGRVFRDEEELTASPSLPASIENALVNSKWLIVICTPRAAASEWVEREVSTFIEAHGRKRVLAVLVEGEPETSFPEALRTDGVSHLEPLACDLRRARGIFARRRELLRLIAPIIGCGYDELIQRRHRRHTKIAATVACTAILTLSVLLAVSWSNTQRLRATESIALAKHSREQLAGGDRMGAIQTALNALPPANPGPLDRPFVDEAQGALAEALGVYPSDSPVGFQFRPCYERRMGGRIEDIAISPDASVIAARDSTSTIDCIDAETGKVLSSIYPDRERMFSIPDLITPRQELLPSFTGEIVLTESHILVGFSYTDLACFNISDGSLAWGKAGSIPAGYSISHDEAMAAIVSRNTSSKDEEGDTLFLAEMSDGEDRAEIPLPSDFSSASTPLFSSDDSHIFIPGDNALAVVNVADHTVSTVDWEHGAEAVCVESGSTLIAADTSSEAAGQATVSAIDYGNETVLWHASIATDENSTGQEASPSKSFVVPASDSLCFVISGTTLAAIDTNGGTVLATHRLPDVAADAISIDSLEQIGAEDVYVTLQNGERRLYFYTDGQILYVDLEGLDGPRLSDSAAVELDLFSGYLQASSPIDDGSSLEVHQLKASYAVDGFEPLAIGRFTPPFLDSDGSHFFVITPDATRKGYQLAIYDASTCAPTCTIDLESLGITELDSSFRSTRIPHRITLSQTDDSGTLTISTIDAEDGSLVAQRSWQADERAGCTTHAAYGLLCVLHGNEIELLDERTLETVEKHSAVFSTPPRLIAAIASEKTVLVIRSQYADGEQNLALLDRSTGELISDADISSYSVATVADADACFLVDESRHALAIACQDGMLRSFDLNNGDLLWECAINATSSSHISMTADNETLVLQESTGRLIALDAETGELEGASEDIPGELRHFIPTTDPHVLAGVYLNEIGSEDQGIFTLHLASDGLHIRDVIPHAVHYSEEAGKAVIVHSGVMGTIPYYDYRELRALGEQTLQAYGE